ncbi:MAG: hypothetical protein Q9227_008512 [Pyrenula ochraceoflavens]
MEQQTPSPIPPSSFLSPTSPAPVDPNPGSSPHHSPFHSLHRKFRRPSASNPPDQAVENASRLSPSQLVGPKPPSKHDETYKEAARAAKRFIKDNVRNDWEFCVSSENQAFAKLCPTTSAVDQMAQEEHDRIPIDYVRRQSGSSDPTSDDEGFHDARDPMWAEGDAGDEHTFKFESPDDVGNAIQARRKAKRKREKEEMEWNIGLRTWTARRNAWTGATKTKPPRRLRRKARSSQDRPGTSSADSTLVDNRSEQSSIRPLSPPDSHSDLDMGESELEKSDTDSDASSDGRGPYLPIHPPLLPSSNVVRAAIGPNLYPMIYSKVVVQGLSPSVPIPLTHLVKAVVRGWKDEGNWPPKGSNEPMGEGKVASKSNSSGVVAQAKREAMRLYRLGRDKDHDSSHHHRKGGSIGGMGGAVRKAFGLKGHKSQHEHDTPKGGGVSGYAEQEEEMEWDGDFLEN